MLSGMAIRITFISAGGPIVTRATFMYPTSRVVFSASKQKLSLRKIAREEESRVLSRYSRAHGLISFPWGVRDINQYVLRTRGGGGGGGRRRVNVSFSSSSPLMERWNGRETWRKREERQREKLVEVEKGWKEARGSGKDPWWTRSPFLEGYPSLVTLEIGVGPSGEISH